MKTDTLHDYFVAMGRKGGKTRAAKHSKKELARWGRKGGRPRKAKRGNHALQARKK